VQGLAALMQQAGNSQPAADAEPEPEAAPELNCAPPPAQQARPPPAQARQPHVPAWPSRVQRCPTFHPSAEEFANPLAYLSGIFDQVAPFGMAKIVPPVVARSAGVDVLRAAKAPLNQQLVCDVSARDWEVARSWPANSRTAAGFAKVADAVSTKVFQTTLPLPAQAVEVRCTRWTAHASSCVRRQSHGV
jgi:jmjN domain